MNVEAPEDDTEMLVTCAWMFEHKQAAAKVRQLPDDDKRLLPETRETIAAWNEGLERRFGQEALAYLVRQSRASAGE